MIAFVVALKKEAQILLEKVENLKEFKLADKPCYSFTLNAKDCVLAISGVGKVSASLTTQLLIDKYSPQYIINFGTCGGTNSNVEILNFYLVDKCCQYDFDLTPIDDVPLGYIQEYDRVYFDTFTNGLDFLQKRSIASADKFTCKQTDIDIINDLGCSMCDFEAGAVVQVCTSNSVPAIIVKAISDVFGSGSQPEQFSKNLMIISEKFPSVISKLIDNINF
ncbi:MAG: 5'-methylthioadenosine/S-adenosylhomocysteine nucleosidase [Clostridiales bacterium]|nr:5'-methylthioadenosine/S-adenosylhomocysteine nucleosidase [Clostridiales bacterium]